MSLSVLRVCFIKCGVLAWLSFSQLSAVSLPPAPMENYCPVVVVNNTTLPANEIYFVAHGNDPNGMPCFLVPDANGVCQYVYPTPSGIPSSAGSSVLLSNLPTATGTGITTGATYLVYLPVDSSSRAYFSLQSPMYLATALNPKLGVLDVNDSSITSLTDPNFYTLYQDFEFGLVEPKASNLLTALYMNLSWVDYFCLPMQLYTLSYPSNTPINSAVSLPSGTNASMTREQIISKVNKALTKGQTYASWGNLGVPYYNDPYTDTTPASYVRILAAKNSIDLGLNPVQFQGAKVTPAFFPANYVSSPTYGPTKKSGTLQSFMQSVYTYYTTPANALWVKIFPANESPAIYQITSTSDATNLTLQFVSTTAGAPSPITLELTQLSMEKLLSGSVWPFIPASTPANYTNELSKVISAFFTIGQLPYTASTTSAASPFVNNNAGFAAIQYFNNPPGYINGPWYNLYDELLHQQMIGQGEVPKNPTLGLGYAYDFDDLLNMSGLINGLEIQDQYGNPSEVVNAVQPYVVISLESLSGTTIPNISQDTYAYETTVASAPNGVAVSFSHYNGTTTVVTPASTSENVDLGVVHVDATHPFQVTFTFDSVEYVYNINLQRQIVTPISDTSTFSSTDQYFQGSVTFEKVSGSSQANPAFFIQFNSAPPPWPG